MIKIALSDLSGKVELKKNLTYPVTVLKYTNNSTLIQIKGHVIHVPLLLSPEKTYRAVLKKGKLVIETTENQSRPQKSLITGKKTDKEGRGELPTLLKSLFLQSDPSDKDLSLFAIPYYITGNGQDKSSPRKSAPFLLKSREDDSYFLFFNLPVYDRMAKLSLKICPDKSLFLTILLSSPEDISRQQMQEELQHDLNSIAAKHTYSLSIRILSDEQDFYRALEHQTGVSGIDLTI